MCVYEGYQALQFGPGPVDALGLVAMLVGYAWRVAVAGGMLRVPQPDLRGT